MENSQLEEGQPRDRYGAARFNRHYPPPSIDVAKTRLDDLADEIVRLSSELHEKELDDFEKDVDFRNWRARAIAAKGHLMVEQAYLKRWLEILQIQNSSPELTSTVPNPDHLTQKCPEFMLAMSSALKATNTIISGFQLDTLQEWTPQDEPKAHEMREKLGQAITKIQEEMLVIVTEAKRRGLRKADQKDLKKLFIDIIEKLIAPKQREIRDFLRDIYEANNPAANNPILADWRSITAKALRRAKTAGFVLNPSEDDLLNQLEALLEKRS